ncbi:hypothetical protein B0H21DRAFT_323664 [Amylocystis lapponica]|nr:hypothetical protein B0H21DRAFT_323664 [Amylocystis lapponica]
MPVPLPLRAMADSFTTRSNSSQDPHRPRTLILCFDGTADQYDGTNTNVVKLYSLLNKDESQQLCYYQPGVGTYINPGLVSPLFQWAAKVMDEAFAWYLDEHVRQGYQFLMQNYRPGDKISIFGFSRGAYTARAVAGMVHKIGILPKDNPEQIPFAFRLYTKTDATNLALAEGFKRTFCRSAEIQFVGVWDTVSSVGVLVGRTLPFTMANTTIKTFRHALSLDEHRAKFRPNLYHWPAPTAAGARKDPEHATPVLGTPQMSLEHIQKQLEKKARREEKKLTNLFWKRPAKRRPVSDYNTLDSIIEGDTTIFDPRTLAAAAATALRREVLTDDIDGTDVLEVWFSGCHSDVGGSATPDSTKRSLSDITLHWMVHQVVQAQCGVIFDSDALHAANIPDSLFVGTTLPFTTVAPTATHRTDVAHGDPTNNSSASAPLNPAAQESLDALQPIHDELIIHPLWWLLEVVPLSYAYQDMNGVWHNSWSINFGRGRIIPEKQPKFHITVKERMGDQALKYTPRARWVHGSEVYVG